MAPLRGVRIVLRRLVIARWTAMDRDVCRAMSVRRVRQASPSGDVARSGDDPILRD